MVKFEAPIFDASDRISAFLYDQRGWHLRVIAMWSHVLYTGPVVDLVIAGDRINTFVEWFAAVVPILLGMACLWIFKRASVAQANSYMMVLRTDGFMTFLRMFAIGFAVAYALGAMLSPTLVNIARAVHEIHYCFVIYWVCTIVPDRPRKKRRLLPVLKLFPDPLPQGT